MSLAGGLILALMAALALNVGFFVQHGATHSMASLSLHHPLRSARLLVTDRQWMLGYLAGWVGWGLYIAALSLAPLSSVQAVAAGGVGVLAFLAHKLGTPLERREQVGAWIAVAGLVLLVISLAFHTRVAPPARSSTLLIVVIAGSALAGLLVVLSVRAARPAALLGGAAGLLFGVGDLATKGAVNGNGLLFVPILAACTALAFVTLQMAFQRGRVLQTAGLSILVNNMIPIIGGVAIFHEALPGGGAAVLRIISFVAVVAGAVLLAHGPEAPVAGQEETAPPLVLNGTPTG